MPPQPEDMDTRNSLEQRIEHLEKAHSQLVQLVNILANDLRSPLRHVTGFCRIVKHEYSGKLGPRGIAFLDNAVVGAKRIRELVDDLVMLTRVQQEDFKREPISLATIFDEVTASLSKQIRESNARITSERLPSIETNGELIGLLMKNLLDNAIKYRGDNRPQLHIAADRVDNNYWQVSVSDNGIGIAPERHEAIFDAFQRFADVNTAYPASGLGLFVCKEIVELHGGKIWIESRPEGGSVFRFTIADKT